MQSLMQMNVATFWFTGLSGAGKTTLALGLEREIRTRDLRVEVLDGDLIRNTFQRDWVSRKKIATRTSEGSVLSAICSAATACLRSPLPFPHFWSARIRFCGSFP